MKSEYDLSRMKHRPNPYAKRLKRQVTIRMGVDVIEYFKAMSKESGIPYQNLINLYLRDCVDSGAAPVRMGEMRPRAGPQVFLEEWQMTRSVAVLGFLVIAVLLATALSPPDPVEFLMYYAVALGITGIVAWCVFRSKKGGRQHGPSEPTAS